MPQGVSQQIQTEEDIKFLLSNVRARQNGLVFFLQLFTMATRSRIQPQQYRIYKQEFLEKQKIYTAQIKQLQEKLITVPLNNIQVRSFWMKLKSILRVSLERARLMGILSESLARKYQEVMTLIAIAHQQSFQMREYLRVQNMLKKRTVQAMMTAKQLLSDNSGVLDSLQGNKNRSQTILKLSIKPTESVDLSPNRPKICNIREQDSSTINKLKSITRVKKKGQKIRLQNNQIKKSQLAWHRYENIINDVMDCKPENFIDKKKSKSENEDKIYDQLFDRNINNHKIIAKYSHHCTKLKLMLAQINKSTKKRLVSQKKFNEGARQHEIISDKNIMGRAKTSKKHKTANVRIQSGQSQKVSDLLKGT